MLTQIRLVLREWVPICQGPTVSSQSPPYKKKPDGEAAAMRSKGPPVLSGASLQADVQEVPEEILQIFLSWGWTTEEVNRDVLGPGIPLPRA